MRFTLAVIALLSVSSIAAEASSRQTPPPAAPVPRNVPPAPPAWTRIAETRAIDQMHAQHRARQRAEAEEARTLPERRARAERLAALANSGRCTEAIGIARSEGDLDMATRLEEACSRQP